MSNTDTKRVWSPEGGHTFRSNFLDDILNEIDMRLSCKEMYGDVTRVGGLIDKMTYYSDVARTDKVLERTFGYTSGKITSILNIFYNADGTEDSRVTETLTRDVNEDIISCDNPFTTTEDIEC